MRVAFAPVVGAETIRWRPLAEQVHPNDWDVQFKEIADALRGSAIDEGGKQEDPSALLEQVRRILAADPEQLRE